MGFLSCNADSAIATCDPHYWHLKNNKTNTITTRRKRNHTIKEFLYTDLLAATNAFSAETYLGKGSHGRVYKATLNLPNHHHHLIAAVKTTKLTTKPIHKHPTNCTGCGNCTSPAENEIEILSQVPSPRLVNLIGYCTDPNGNKLIVVEYMPNGSLHDLLHSATRPPGWTRRIRFALQVAKAIRELHSSNPPVIHRDIKSTNVLIDGDWNARLGDFGLALRGHVEDVRVKCTPPAGTLGYLDPCYLAPEDLSAKSDVFSFGILLLEIISGRNAIDVNYSPPSVVDWAVPLIRRGDYDGICDRRIGTPFDPTVIRQLAIVAARCVRSTAEKRPAMVEVVECVKLAKKRIEASRIWSSLRRRVARVESTEAYDGDYDSSEEVVKRVKCGSRRKSKVSSVAGTEYGRRPSWNKSNGPSSVRAGTGRSRSLNKSGIKMVLETNSKEREFGFERRWKDKRALMRLKKSKSTGVLRSPIVLHYGDTNNDEINSCEMIASMSNLLITDNSKSEKEMLEKPLVNNSHGWESE